MILYGLSVVGGQLLYDVGMLGGSIVLLGCVFCQVVELHHTAVAVVVDDAFPVALQDGSAAPVTAAVGLLRLELADGSVLIVGTPEIHQEYDACYGLQPELPFFAFPGLSVQSFSNRQAGCWGSCSVWTCSLLVRIYGGKTAVFKY